MKNGDRESIVLLFRAGAVRQTGSSPLAKLTLVQTTEQDKVVGGSTFVLRAKGR